MAWFLVPEGLVSPGIFTSSSLYSLLRLVKNESICTSNRDGRPRSCRRPNWGPHLPANNKNLQLQWVLPNWTDWSFATRQAGFIGPGTRWFLHSLTVQFLCSSIIKYKSRSYLCKHTSYMYAIQQQFPERGLGCLKVTVKVKVLFLLMLGNINDIFNCLDIQSRPYGPNKTH